MDVPVTVDVGDYAAIVRLCRTILTRWADFDVQLVTFKEGSTNTLYACVPVKKNNGRKCDELRSSNGTATEAAGDKRLDTLAGLACADRPIIVRIFGSNTAQFIDRASELHYLKELSALGLSSHVLAEFQNGLVYEYIRGVTLTRQLFRDKTIAWLVASHLSTLHNAPVKPFMGDKRPVLFMTLRKYVKMLKARLDSQNGEQSPLVQLKDVVARADTAVPKLEGEMTHRFGEIETVFCHNDLLTTNVIYNEQHGTVRFIDFEYSGYNYASYDVANHLNEFAGMVDADFSLIPEHEEIRCWCESYSRARWPSQTPEQRDLSTFVEQVEFFMPLSHLFWSLWSFLQSFHSRKTFPYFDYGLERFKLFLLATK